MSHPNRYLKDDILPLIGVLLFTVVALIIGWSLLRKNAQPRIVTDLEKATLGAIDVTDIFATEDSVILVARFERPVPREADLNEIERLLDFITVAYDGAGKKWAVFVAFREDPKSGEYVIYTINACPLEPDGTMTNGGRSGCALELASGQVAPEHLRWLNKT